MSKIKTNTNLAPPESAAPLVEVSEEIKISVEDALGRIYSTGKRKNAIARVWIKPGHGTITINKKPVKDYFGRFVLNIMVAQPFKVAECENQWDAVCTVKGGGLSGQAGALCHGISCALAAHSLDKRKKLKAEGLLTRDSRIVERKKYGRRKARRSFQFSKR